MAYSLGELERFQLMSQQVHPDILPLCIEDLRVARDRVSQELTDFEADHPHAQRNALIANCLALTALGVSAAVGSEVHGTSLGAGSLLGGVVAYYLIKRAFNVDRTARASGVLKIEELTLVGYYENACQQEQYSKPRLMDQAIAPVIMT